ncbi:MAG: hypothetical protein RRA92_10885, partial [Gemmatimonadota bacterium]|nr:hypothetical protein [Gemmatimonadota bacterium]
MTKGGLSGGRGQRRDGTSGEGGRAGLALAVACVILAACGPADRRGNGTQPSGARGPDDAGAEVRTEDGDGWATEAAWRLELDLRVGSRDGPDAFGRLVQVSPRRAGGLWTLDAQSLMARAFDDTGREVVTLGGPGEGPGELRHANGMREAGDGRLAVFEAFPPRLHWFDRDGTWLASRAVSPVTIGAVDGGPRFGVWDVTDEGVPLLDVFGMPMPGRAVEHHLLRLPPAEDESLRVDTVLSWSVPPRLPSMTGPIAVLRPQPEWDVAPDGSVVWTPGAPYEIWTLPADGGTARIVRRPGEADRVTAAVRSAVEDQLRRVQGETPGLAESMIERLQFPERLPHLSGVWVSRPDRTVYVARFTAESA